MNRNRQTQVKEMLKALHELGETYGKTNDVFKEITKEISSIQGSIEHEPKDETAKKLVKIGAALLAFPEPVVSNIFGSALISAGLVMKKLDGKELTIRDMHEELHKRIQELSRLKNEIVSSKF